VSAAEQNRRRLTIFVIVAASVLAMPLLGPGPMLASVIVGCALLGIPLFALIGIITVFCYLAWGEKEHVNELSPLIERIQGLADPEDLLAVPLFMLSGAIMSRGQISSRLIDFSKALIGWIPGGLAVSAVVACMLFAAISGSSPATVVAIGAMMGPSLIKHGYSERFSHGLLTSSGSLGILIPPSIPMVLYPIVNQNAGIKTEELFAAGIGPGLIIGGILAAFCVYRGIVDRAARQAFSVRTLGASLFDGFWSLLFPLVILGGIYTGFFGAVEAAGVSVVYAIVVEVWIHRALRLGELPKIFQETGILLGSLLVIMVAALSFSEFLYEQQIPQAAVAWIESLHLHPIVFLIILNLLLLLVGTMMDILSAMFIFVPLLAPIALSMGVDPMHFGIIFIVNLEIGYLTPPVGLNLFVASTLFDKPLGHMVRAVGPFIVLMLVGLGVITYFPAVSIGLGSVIMGTDERPTPQQFEPLGGLEGLDDEAVSPVEAGGEAGGRVQTVEEMMRELEGLDDEESADEPSGDADELTPIERDTPGRMLNMDEMMEAAGVE
jgi:C4-dicarboxylate transporter, DctM subunit